MEAKDADFPPEVRTALRLDAAALFASGREVVIAHAGEFYRLRLTRQNRLILTK
jgi:hemin uptake protein HemP